MIRDILARVRRKAADLSGASLQGTDLRGVDLRQVLGLTAEQLREAIIDETTLLPEHLERQLRKR